MTAAQIAQLAIVLAPVVSNIVVEGGKVVATYRSDLTQDQINQSLDLSRSTNWPALDFGQAA